MSDIDDSALANKRRDSHFELSKPKHLVAIGLGALLAAIIMHWFGFHILTWLGVGIDVPATEARKDEPKVPDDYVIVLTEDTQHVEELAEEPEDVEAKMLEKLDPQELPDLEDMPLEDVVIAPGETSVSLDTPTQDTPEMMNLAEPQFDMESVMKGMPEPSTEQEIRPNLNPVTIPAVAQPDAVNPDAWYNEKLKGAGGKDDSHLPDGSKTLSQLMAQPNLGKNSGYSRLGADLLFEYNKAVMKQSARISMLQLANLIMKNPDTTFIVEGHTDSFGAEKYNHVLSMMRANAVRDWLVKNGIPLLRSDGSSRVYIRACGASRPVVSIKGDKNAQSANRRVEIHMRRKGEEIPADAKPLSYRVDMTTPISEQARQVSSSSLPVLRPESTEVKPLPLPKPQPPVIDPIKPQEPIHENIPDAAPIEEIPEALPVEDIPDAVPIEEIPNAEPLN